MGDGLLVDGGSVGYYGVGVLFACATVHWWVVIGVFNTSFYTCVVPYTFECRTYSYKKDPMTICMFCIIISLFEI